MAVTMGLGGRWVALDSRGESEEAAIVEVALCLLGHGSLVPRPLPPGKGPGAHRLRMCKITSKISVKVSVHYNLPRGTLTSSSNKKLGKSLSRPLPANRPNERFAFV